MTSRYRNVIAEISSRPILLITTDELETKAVRRYCGFARGPKSLWQIPEIGHGGGFAARPEEYAQRLVSFYSEAL